ncbi:MAG: DUF3160 domain-containing protein [Syntrophobacteraceae bacterium]|jgi:hypothetical protein
MSKSILCFLFMILAASSVAYAGVFDIEEIKVAPSPAQEKYLQLKHTEKVLDFDVAKDGPETAILIENQTGGSKVVFWNPGAPEITEAWAVPKGFSPRALAWHPAAKSFFLAGRQGSEHVILRVDKGISGWGSKLIYKTAGEIRRLVPAPRPFEIETGISGDESQITKAYRIFFGVKNPDGTYSIKSVTEDGKREYQAVGPKKGFTTFKGADEQPSRIEALSALPVAFHPAGHILLWEDEKGGFQYALYDRDHWGKSIKLSYPEVSGGTLTPTPNGLALIHWRPGSGGVTIISRHGSKRDLLASEYSLLSTPSSVPDGRGIIGLINKGKDPALVYLPLPIPLADVANAWMFADEQEDEQLLNKNGGLLRDLPDDQLYSMYESEAYYCGAYDQSTPTRPYLVTTDVFWELLGAAYEGMFIIEERRVAIPAFWEFVQEAERYLRQAKPDSPWAQVFSILANMGKAASDNENVASELLRIQKAGGREFSPVLGEEADYGELAPRGHYNSSEAMKTYFKAFKYLTVLAAEAKALPPDDLGKMPPEVIARAHAWAASYNFFIAPSRSPVFCEDKMEPPPYAKHPLKRVGLFPLSWGVDNEVLLSTVFHEDWPVAEQVKGPSGPRLIPSGLDIASALGSGFATALLSTEIETYPALRKVLEDLRIRLSETGKGAGNDANIYNSWIAALALQWADDAEPPGASREQELWHAKRLQTGLATWATLRHATVLVNERTGAECGEAAFEPILLTPPRGYVEPDPRTFDAIGALFQSMEQQVKLWAPSSKDTIQVTAEGVEREAVKEGVIRRLSETAAKARLFKTIAEKEIKGEPLSNQEYEEILLIGGIAEHHFLIFKSLASEQLALSTPDPMPKIADVAGGGPANVPFLMAAVGRPMEWDHIAPYFGRRQIAKGAVYSYYEFTSERLINDQEWLGLLPSAKHPKWISPFVSGSSPACPPQNPF